MICQVAQYYCQRVDAHSTRTFAVITIYHCYGQRPNIGRRLRSARLGQCLNVSIAVFVCACVCACAHACVRACVRVYVWYVCVCVCGVWCGVVWCCVVLCGVVLCGVVWCGVCVCTLLDGDSVAPTCSPLMQHCYYADDTHIS